MGIGSLGDENDKFGENSSEPKKVIIGCFINKRICYKILLKKIINKSYNLFKSAPAKK